MNKTNSRKIKKIGNEEMQKELKTSPKEFIKTGHLVISIRELQVMLIWNVELSLKPF